MQLNTIIHGDALEVLRSMPSDSVHCGVTSPPYYGLRDYGVEGQIGLEKSPEEYIARLVEIFREFRRVLRPDGTLWVNIGDSYAGSGKGAATHPDNAKKYVQGTNKGTLAPATAFKFKDFKPKDLVGIPWMLAFALRADGWYLRQDIIWHKPNPMPESVKDRCTKAHEYIFLLSKSKKYYFDHEAILEPAAYDGRKDTLYKGGSKDMSCAAHERWPNKIRGYAIKDGSTGLQPSHHGSSIPTYPARNKRDVWTVCTKPFKDAHFAVFPEALVSSCILAGCPQGGVVLDMFGGSGTTARKLGRNFMLIDLNKGYCEMAKNRVML